MDTGDYKRRTQSATTSVGVSSGFLGTPVHVTGDGNPHEVCQAGGVVSLTSINDTSTTGVNMYFKDASGNTQAIFTGAKTARDYIQHFYCPWPVYVTSDVDVTVYVHAPSKGNTQD